MSMNGVKVVYACEYCGKMFKEVELCRQCAIRCKEAKDAGKAIVRWRHVAATIRYGYADSCNHYIEIRGFEWKDGFIQDGDYTHVFGLSNYTPNTVDKPYISDLDDDGLSGFMYQIQGHTKFEDDESLKEAFAEAFKDKLKEIANEL